MLVMKYLMLDWFIYIMHGLLCNSSLIVSSIEGNFLTLIRGCYDIQIPEQATRIN